MSKIYVLGHLNPDVDSIVSGYLLTKMLKKKGVDIEFIIPDKKIDSQTLEVCHKYGLDPQKYQKPLPKSYSRYILVDHNDREVNGKIIAILDHHPCFKNNHVKYYYNKHISSTTCLICRGNEKMLSDNDLRLAFVAAMVDTASFHSTKGRKKDKDWIKKYCQIRNISYESIYTEGLMLTPLKSVKKAALNGLKKYSINDLEIESSYVQISNDDNKHINKIVDYLKNYRREKNLFCFIFIVHNMTRFTSKVFIILDNDVKIKFYDQYTSRGDKIIPDVLKKVKNYDIF